MKEETDRNFLVAALLRNDTIPKEREYWLFNVYYTSPQSFIITFSYWLNSQLWGHNQFRLVGSLSLVSKHFNQLLQSTEEVILYDIIGDVHQFIGHYLIPLDPCTIIPVFDSSM